MLLNDKEITRLATEQGMISPFIPGLVKKNANGVGVLSYGTSSYGYDLRAGETFKVRRFGFHEYMMAMTGLFPALIFASRKPIDMKRHDDNEWRALPVQEDETGRFVELPPLTFALCDVVEYIKLPRNVTAQVNAKSTPARNGLIIYTTVGEAGWEGVYVVEMSNQTFEPMKIYCGEGIAQILFNRSNDEPETDYGDRGGKYQGQTGLTHGKV